jgi:hypothetical protein
MDLIQMADLELHRSLAHNLVYNTHSISKSSSQSNSPKVSTEPHKYNKSLPASHTLSFKLMEAIYINQITL